MRAGAAEEGWLCASGKLRGLPRSSGIGGDRPCEAPRLGPSRVGRVLAAHARVPRPCHELSLRLLASQAGGAWAGRQLRGMPRPPSEAGEFARITVACRSALAPVRSVHLDAAGSAREERHCLQTWLFTVVPFNPRGLNLS